MDKILLIDGNSMLFRAYYASAYSKMMTTSNQIPTNAIVGFVMMLNKAIEMINPDKLFVAWDAGKSTFRHEFDSTYKGTRKELDPQLKVQFPIIREFLDSAKIKRFECEGIEADDIIGSFAKAHRDCEIHILSSDRDLLQLISDNCDVYLMKKGISEIEVMNEAKLMETMGIKPHQIIDLKALMGDSADNIPGVKGIGEKGALKLLAQYESVDGVYEHIDEIKGKLKEKLVDGKESAMRSKFLATIKTDAQIPLTLDELSFNGYDEGVNNFFIKYEMKRFVIHNEEKKEIKIEAKQVHKVSNALLQAKAMVYACYDQELFYDRSCYGFAISNGEINEYISIDDIKNDLEFMNYLKQDNAYLVYDAKNFYHICHQYQIKCGNIGFDVMIACFLIDNSINDFDKLNNKYQLGITMNKDDIFGKKGKPKLVDEEEVKAFGIEIANKLYRISNDLIKELNDNQMMDLFQNIEMPLTHILYNMEKEGVTCDKKVLDEIAQATLKKIDYYLEQIYECAGHEFNVNSPKQLAVVLYDELGLVANKKRSTAADVLEKLVHVHPIIPLLLQQRKYAKIYSTYANGLGKHILSDGKIHTLFHQIITQTGRLSSSDPNLQNISIKDEEGKEIRKAFICEENHVLLSADYSQVELRMLAHMANEASMIDAFNHGIDIHTKTAMQIYDVKKEEVDALMRRSAKTVNFGIVYGQSDFGLSEQLNISRKEAKYFIDKYNEAYPKIKEFMDNTISFCEEHGYVETLFHRRRYISEIHDKNYMMREFGKRAAMNAPIQGSAADLIKVAMIKVDEAMRKNNLKSKMILQIHDELIFDVVSDELEIMKQLVKESMEKAIELKVPLIADVNVGKNWYDAK